MVFTSPTEDIIVQEGTFAFDYDCSGTISKGQAVEAIGTFQVRTIPAAEVIGHGCVGVAAYAQTNGNPIAVYGPGNICRICASSTTIAAGDVLFAGGGGYFAERNDHTAGASGVNAIALEAAATDGTACRVMLF